MATLGGGTLGGGGGANNNVAAQTASSARILESIARLEAIPTTDDQPYIEAPAGQLLVETIADTNFVDANAYANQLTVCFNEEIQLLAAMVRGRVRALPAARGSPNSRRRPACHRVGWPTAAQNQHLQQGETFLSILYSYRSLSRAIPLVRRRPSRGSARADGAP